MDPITALQTASAIIGIVDFGTRLLSDTYKIYQSASGLTASHAGLATLSDELNSLGKQLQGRLQAAPSEVSASDRTLQSLSVRCVEASDKLHSAISDLEANSSGNGKIRTAANSFASALRAVRKNDDIQALREELTEIRSQITCVAIISLLLESKQDAQRNLELTDRLDQIVEKLDRRDDTTRQFAKELAQITVPKKLNDFSRRNTDLVDILWGMDWKSWAASHGGELLIDSQSVPHTHVGRVPIPIKILTSLSFREINSRKEVIPEAYASTCSWIFRDSEIDENGEQLDWPSFPKWLRQRDERIYWITGKLGSGKSTLMKYIVENPELQTHLREYAGDLPPLKANFFFWNPGSEMETSRQGLLRTLLHQCLRARPELIPAVAPRRWALYSLLGGDGVAPEWTWKELKESFDILCSRHGQDFRLALFIDGLDEFKEPEKSPDSLISWIYYTSTHYGIKICVSSRPWSVFADAFGREPSLTMQNLSRRDIRHFVRTEFDKSIPFQELREVFPDDATSIVEEIFERAQGVFLWVNLVVRNLLSTLIDNPSPADLKLKLAEIPNDITGLYNAIWRSIPTERQCRSSKILQICIESSEPCKAEIMWLATEVNPNPQDVTNAGIHKILKRILDGHTKGICELVLGDVRFFHRSAADWIKINSTGAELCSKTPPEFEPNLNLLEAYCHYHTVMEKSGLPTTLELPHIVRLLFVKITKFYRTATADRISLLSVRMIQTMDNVNKLGYDISSAGKQTYQSKNPTPEGWSTTHWLAQRTKSRSLDENCFVGSAASVGFVDYVKKKLQDDPSLLIPKEGRVSILENAILIAYSGEEYLFASGSDPTRHSYLAGKLEIIRFILETSPHQYTTARGQPMWAVVSRPYLINESSELTRWRQEVLDLLEEFGYNSPTIRRSLVKDLTKQWEEASRNRRKLTGPNNESIPKTTGLLRWFRVYFGKCRTSKGEGG